MLMRGVVNKAPNHQNLFDLRGALLLQSCKPSCGFLPQRALSSLYVLLLHTPAGMLRAQSSWRVFKSNQNQRAPLTLAHAYLPYL